MLQATGLTAERLFIVPGNHDLDRSAFELLPDSILKPFDSDTLVKEWLTNDKKRDRLREPFEAYREFVTQYTHQTQPDYSNIRIELEAHFNELIPKIKNGLVVPFLGADINLCDRTQDANLIPRPWDWNPQGDYPPTSVELAAYLDQSHEYLKTVRCPLWDTDTLPSACPIMTEFVTRLDLQNVSQYLNIQGEKTINQAITEIAKHKYKANRLHRLHQLPYFIYVYSATPRITQFSPN